MSKPDLIENMYALYTQMTVANGFNFDWGKIEADRNGSPVWGDVPMFHLKFEDEENADEVNGLGNNEFQNTLPVVVIFGATQSTPSDTMNTVTKERDKFKAQMLRDIKRAFGSPYKINMPDFYCGSTYNGEVPVEDDDDEIDPYTVLGSASITVTYKESRGIGEW